MLLTDISRSLEESIQLQNTVESLSDYLTSFDDKEPHILMDDSEIVKTMVSNNLRE